MTCCTRAHFRSIHYRRSRLVAYANAQIEIKNTPESEFREREIRIVTVPWPFRFKVNSNRVKEAAKNEYSAYPFALKSLEFDFAAHFPSLR